MCDARRLVPRPRATGRCASHEPCGARSASPRGQMCSRQQALPIHRCCLGLSRREARSDRGPVPPLCRPGRWSTHCTRTDLPLDMSSSRLDTSRECRCCPPVTRTRTGRSDPRCATCSPQSARGRWRTTAREAVVEVTHLDHLGDNDTATATAAYNRVNELLTRCAHGRAAHRDAGPCLPRRSRPRRSGHCHHRGTSPCTGRLHTMRAKCRASIGVDALAAALSRL